MQGEHAQLTLHVFDIELLLDLLRNPAYKAQQVFEKLVAGNMVTGVQVKHVQILGFINTSAKKD